MKVYRTSLRPFIFVMVLLFVTFLLFLTISPLVTFYKDNLNNNSESSDLSANKNESFRHIKYYPTLAILPAKETFDVITVIEAINNSFRDSEHFLCGGFNALAQLLFGMVLLIYSFLSSYRMMDKHLSVIAVYIGGHAPPVIHA